VRRNKVCHFLLLCDFHTYQPIERTLTGDLVPSSCIRKYMTHVHSLLEGNLTFDQETVDPLLKEATASKDASGFLANA